MKYIALIAIALIPLIGCGKPTIDGSSKQSIEASSEKVKAALPPEKQSGFEQAVQLVAFNAIEQAGLFDPSKKADPEAIQKVMRKALDGKTGEEVIALAASIQAERDAAKMTKESNQKAEATQAQLLAEDLQRTKRDYIKQIDLYDFEASTINLVTDKNAPAVRFKLKNKGDRTLNVVEVTVYFKDADGNVIFEEDFYPVGEGINLIALT